MSDRRISFLSLPDEILTAVLILLDIRDILRFSTACKYCHELVTNSIELQYKICLEADGLVDHWQGSLSIRERLDLLSEYRQAWRTTWGKKTVTIHQPVTERCLFRMVNGVAAFLGLTGYTASAGLSGSRELTFYRLPSRTDDSSFSWNFSFELNGPEAFDRQYWDFDPNQDLLVYLMQSQGEKGEVVHRVRVYTLSANMPHPCAAKAVIHCPIPLGVSPCGLRIMGNNVVFWERSGAILLLNWKTGDVILTEKLSSCPGFPPKSVFVLITPKVFITASRSGPGSLELYVLHDGHVKLVTSLQFPPIRQHASIIYICFSNRIFSPNPNPDREFPFQSAPMTGRILCLDMEYNDQLHTLSYRFIIHLRIIQSYISAFEEGSQVPKVVPWSQWGPANTRVPTVPETQQDIYSYDFRDVAGQRILFTQEDGRRVILEAGYHLKRPAAAIESPHRPKGDTLDANLQVVTKTVLEPSTVTLDEGFFADPVVTRLPYRLTIISGKGSDPMHCMLDDRRLVEVYRQDKDENYYSTYMEVTVL